MDDCECCSDHDCECEDAAIIVRVTCDENSSHYQLADGGKEIVPWYLCQRCYDICFEYWVENDWRVIHSIEHI